jgi:hypothetical protein
VRHPHRDPQRHRAPRGDLQGGGYRLHDDRAFDLSTELGVSGQLDAPELVEAVSCAEKVIRDAGIPLGGAAPTPQTRAMMSRDYRLLWHQIDVLILKQFVQQTAAWRAG